MGHTTVAASNPDEAVANDHGTCLLNLSRAGPSSVTGTPPRSPLSVGLHVKQAQEREVFTVVRRQMDVLEERLSSQIARVQQQSERSRDTALTRLDSKLGTMELLQPRVDRRLAELNGNLKALSEESQTQIRRMDQMDARLWEWRHKLDEEIRAKFTQIEQTSQELASSVRVAKVTNEDVLKRYHQRLLRLEQLVDERMSQHEEVGSSLAQLHTRLLEVEHDLMPGLRGAPDAVHRDRLLPDSLGAGSTVDVQLQELGQKVTQLQEDSYDLRAKFESQEEHHKTLRTQFEAKDEQYRSLDDRMNRENWDGRLKELQRSIDDIHQGRISHAEQVQILHRKVDSQEEVQAELGGHIRRLQERSAIAGLGLEGSAATTPRTPAFSPAGDSAALAAAAALAAGARGGGSAGGNIQCCLGRLGKVESQLQASNAGVQDCAERLNKVERRLQELLSKVDSMGVDLEVAPRVAALVDTLRDVSPKIIYHEAALKQLESKVHGAPGDGVLGCLLEEGEHEATASA
eukprot:CAMPEP_0179197346 /NCGR_PEP_ID=MMETSP0796-20121207/98138_1 /TAXON_ID=73915 /ORGANISM="Pyrodinium bahamense, Strain pbaha01" /LENGTH=516 /DNA_ID=CAMNT_0020901765 /DNA_START=193 /DNA_END=1739 /DNA_ORIENTATION=+